jgi:hypothetical protein
MRLFLHLLLGVSVSFFVTRVEHLMMTHVHPIIELRPAAHCFDGLPGILHPRFLCVCSATMVMRQKEHGERQGKKREHEFSYVISSGTMSLRATIKITVAQLFVKLTTTPTATCSGSGLPSQASHFCACSSRGSDPNSRKKNA